MRFHYPNLDRPKKAAKRVARLLGDRLPLSKVQNGLATVLGYRDWHELELAHSAQPPMPLDQDLSRGDFRSRSADLTLKIARALDITAGEALYVLLASRLTGDAGTIEDQFAIRLQCWKVTGDWPASGMAGTTVRFRGSFAGPRRLAMLTADFGRERDSPVQIITDNRCGICTREEISIPRDPLPPFLPHRLYFVYGAWTEPDGSKVLFSRDYAPLWRLRGGQRPQQVPSTDWIKHQDETWFWEDATAPWEDRHRQAEEEARLKSFGITGLPLLIDLLPLMVTSVGNVRMPAGVLRELQLREKSGPPRLMMA